MSHQVSQDEEESLPANETIYVNNLNEKIKGDALKTALRVRAATHTYVHCLIRDVAVGNFQAVWHHCRNCGDGFREVLLSSNLPGLVPRSVLSTDPVLRRRGQAFVVFETIDSAREAKERMQVRCALLHSFE